MMKPLKTSMKASISEILEKMFYISYQFDDTLDLETSGIMSSDKTLSCRLNFKGPFSGHFILLVPQKLLFNLTERFMGLGPDEINEHHLDGTIKELINMMAGSTFANYDEEAEFHLAIPEFIEPNKIPESGKNPDKKEYFVLTETIQGYLALKLIQNNI